MPTDLRNRARTMARSIVVGLALLAVVAQLLSLYWPVVTVEGPVIWSDKVVHLALFATPTYAVGLAFRRIWPVALVFALHAPVSELVQHFVLPHRSGDLWDAVADLAGVGLGVLALLAHDRMTGRLTDR